MRGKQMLGPPPRGLWGELAPEPDRWAGTLRITVSALVVAVVMLTFRMPFLAIGPYLVFIVSQRDTLLTRAVAIVAIVIGLLASGLVYLVAVAAWDIAWLRVTLLGAIFYGGYYLMRTLPEPRIILGPLVILALFSYAFDSIPYPNVVLDQLGWIWAIFGLIFVTIFLTQWLLQAPTALDLLRALMRRILVAAEVCCVGRAFGRPPNGLGALARDRADAGLRIKALGATGVLQPAQVSRCLAILQGCNAVLDAGSPGEAPIDVDEKSRLLADAAWLRQLRFRVLLGGDATLAQLAVYPRTSQLRAAFESLARAGSELIHPSAVSTEVKAKTKHSLVPPDWTTNPAYSSFAMRATLATMGCYFFMTLTDWNGIHTCMITCVATALAAAEDRAGKQNLRIVGAIIGGILGMGAAIFLISRFDSLFALLLILGAGSALAAWVSLGSKRVAYAGWQIALAFYMTILQDPHPSTDLDGIWNRWVGIVIGIVAMRVAFSFPTLEEFFTEPSVAVE